MPRVRIKDAHQTLKAIYKDRIFKMEIYGTGNGCNVEIDEMDNIGLHMGFRKSYKVPGRVKLATIIDRYIDDTKNWAL